MGSTPQNLNDDAPLREELVAYLDGELSADESRQVEQRARTEPDARRILEEFDRTWHLLDELDTPPTGEDFTRTTLEMVALAAADDAAKLKAEAPRRRRRARLWTTAALVGAVVVGFLFVASLAPDPDAQFLQDLPLLEKYDQYREIDSIEFLRELIKKKLFTTNTEAGSRAPATVFRAAQTSAQRRQQFDALQPADRRDDLIHNEQIFRSSKPEDEKRLRELHAAIEASPNREELLAVMNRYCKWFDGLQPYRRHQLQRSDLKKRVELIGQLDKQTVSADEIRLDAKNRQAVVRWMGLYIKEHEGRVLDMMAREPRGGAAPPPVPPGTSRGGPEETDPMAGGLANLPPQERLHVVRMLLLSGWNTRNSPFRLAITDAERASLLDSLTPDVRDRVKPLPPAEQNKIITGWLRETASAEFDERLSEYFESLDDKDRDPLMSLPGDEMYARLSEMYKFQLLRQGRPTDLNHPNDDHRRGDHSRRGGPPDGPRGSAN